MTINTRSRCVRTIQNRVRNPIDKIDPAAIPDDRSSLVAHAVKDRKPDSCESEPLIISDVLPVRGSHHQIDANRLHCLMQLARVASRDDLDLMPGLACDHLHI